jgi:predicted dehydrogenase
VDVTGSTPAKARAFADRWGIPSAADTLARLLENDAVHAVYIATPHPAHEVQAIASIEAGKHVLCEKPLTIDVAGAERVIAAARRARVFHGGRTCTAATR